MAVTRTSYQRNCDRAGDSGRHLFGEEFTCHSSDSSSVILGGVWVRVDEPARDLFQQHVLAYARLYRFTSSYTGLTTAEIV